MVTQFDRDRPERNLPDAYSKTADSNNTKLLSIEKGSVDVLLEAVNALYECLDIDKASGKTLDLYGDMLDQLRGTATDDQLRVLIKNKLARNFADSDFNSVVRAIASTFGCKPAEITLTELETPCNVMIEGLPIARINESGIDIGTAVKVITGLMPAGVYVTSLNFSGSFEFSGTELEYDEAAGFADEAQTIGGTFGLISDQTGSNLPI